MAANPLPSQEVLRQLFDYLPDGRLRFRPRDGSPSFNGKFAGRMVLGAINYKGYRRITVAGKLAYEHRVIFKMHRGYDPEQVDHINGVRTDNRIGNLRAASATENCRAVRKIPTSGFKGVYEDKTGRFCARIKVARKDRHLGTFGTAMEAAARYDEAAKSLFNEFAITNASLGLMAND